MDRKHISLGGLRLSSDKALRREKAIEAERAAYRRQYWQQYSKKVKRVFGTLSNARYLETSERAEAHGRSVWGQIWAEAEAYRKGEFLPSIEIVEGQQRLIGELRRIGNNLNQLARLGHMQARKSGGVQALPDDRIGSEAMRLMEALEAKITAYSVRDAFFVCRTCGRKTETTFPASAPDDH